MIETNSAARNLYGTNWIAAIADLLAAQDAASTACLSASSFDVADHVYAKPQKIQTAAKAKSRIAAQRPGAQTLSR